MEVTHNLSPKAQEDMILIAQAVKGDEQAYAKLMNRYRKSVYFMLLRMVNNKEDADDLTMETFAKAFRSLPEFNPTFAFSTWLFKIATNNCIDFIRRQKIKTYSLDMPIENSRSATGKLIVLEDLKPRPDDLATQNQQHSFLRNVIKELPETYRTLIELRYFHEYSYEEIADILEAPLGTVKAQLFRARELLQKALENRREFL